MAQAAILKPFIRFWEGGFAILAGDRGGATKWGVTLATFRSVFGKEKTVDDLKAMTEDEWDYIFKTRFWNRWKADDIKSQPIANMLVDWLWNSGTYGIKLPQKVLKVKIDGIVGPKTLAAINDHPDPHQLFRELWQERDAYFHRIGKGTQKRFLNGWLNRLDGIQYNYLKYNNTTVPL